MEIIAAIAAGAVPSAIGIVRVSGEETDGLWNISTPA